MRVVGWLQEVIGVWMTFEGMEGEIVTGINSVSQPLEPSRGRGDKLWSNSADFRDTEKAVVCSFERTSVRMVSEVFKSEKSDYTSWMDDLNSVWRHFVTNEVEGQVDVLEEERDGEKTVEELAWGVVFQDLHPELLLFTVGALDEVVGVAEVHVIWPHAAELVGSSASVGLEEEMSLLVQIMVMSQEIRTARSSGSDLASLIPSPRERAAVQARANVFI